MTRSLWADDHYLSITKKYNLLVTKHSEGNIILPGECVNLPDINWTNFVIQGIQKPYRFNQTFLNTVVENNLEQFVDSPTATLDFIFSYMERYKPVTLTGKRDHDKVLLDTPLVTRRPKPPRSTIIPVETGCFQGIREGLACFAHDFQSTDIEYSMTLHVGYLQRASAQDSG